MFKNKIKRSRLLSFLQLLCCLLYFKGFVVPLCSAEFQGEEFLEHQKLYDSLFNKTWSKKFIPGLKPVKVEFGFNLINIVEVNAKKQFITLYGWVVQKWNNHLLKWKPEAYNGLDTLNVNSEEIWVPDILLYNNLDEQDRVGGGRSTYKTQVVLYSNGTNIWSSPALFKSFCRIKVRYFPLDNQTCVLKFGSWTHSVRAIDLQPMDLKFPTKYYTKNGEWAVFNISVRKKNSFYPWSETPAYAHIEFAIYISREAFDYLINLIIPCCLISSMIFLGFILPPESGERIGLSMTVLLAMTVFQQLTSEIMPAYDFPILGQYYFAIVLEISASLVVTTVILNFYHRTHRKMPFWIKKILLHWMSRLVFLHGEVSEKYSNKEDSHSNSVRKIHKKQYNDCSRQECWNFKAGLSNKNDPGSGVPTSSYDSCYGENIFGNEQVLDKEGIEMRRLPHVNTYPFDNMADLENKENKRSKDQDLEEKESELQRWEWTIGARILDRCVLVVAVLLGIITVTAVFLRAPSLWKDHRELDVNNPISISWHSTQ